MEIGKQIKKYRTEAGITQDELAEKIFVTRQTISNWENDKNYPDIKSLLLLSSLFDVSLDKLVKGDIENMKEQIKIEDLNRFKQDGTIYTVLLVIMILTPVPLFYFGGWIGFAVWGIIAAISIYFAFRVEKQKKQFNIQTYKEIVAFMDGTSLDEIEKQREYGKRPYQKMLLAVGAGVIALLVSALMGVLVYFIKL